MWGLTVCYSKQNMQDSVLDKVNAIQWLLVVKAYLET